MLISRWCYFQLKLLSFNFYRFLCSACNNYFKLFSWVIFDLRWCQNQTGCSFVYIFFLLSRSTPNRIVLSILLNTRCLTFIENSLWRSFIGLLNNAKNSTFLLTTLFILLCVFPVIHWWRFFLVYFRYSPMKSF